MYPTLCPLPPPPEPLNGQILLEKNHSTLLNDFTFNSSLQTSNGHEIIPEVLCFIMESHVSLINFILFSLDIIIAFLPFSAPTFQPRHLHTHFNGFTSYFTEKTSPQRQHFYMPSTVSKTCLFGGFLSAQAAITKYQRPGGLNNKHFFSGG